MKKYSLQTQLLISIGCMMFSATSFLHSTETATISNALMAGWRHAKKNNDLEAINLLATAIDQFAALQNNLKSIIDTQAETIKKNNDTIAELQKNLAQKAAELRSAASSNTAVAQAQAETQQIRTEKENLTREHQALQAENNTLRSQIALMQHAVSANS